MQLDLACVRKGISPPLLTSHQYIIDQEKKRIEELENGTDSGEG